MSYLYPVGPDGEAEEKKAEKAEEYKVDLRLLNAEINASAHSENSIHRLKQNITDKQKVDKRNFVGHHK